MTELLLKFCFWTHKAVNNNAPEYLCDLIRFDVKSTTIRTRASFDHCLLCVPPIIKTCANSFFDRSFVYAAPTLWNSLDLKSNSNSLLTRHVRSFRSAILKYHQHT